MKKNKLQDYLALALEEMSFEDILEKYDLDPTEVFLHLYENGLIDEEILKAEADIYDE